LGQQVRIDGCVECVAIDAGREVEWGIDRIEPETLVSDDQLVGIADDLFQTLDAEESNGNDAGPG
jgi:hypothetical protein